VNKKELGNYRRERRQAQLAIKMTGTKGAVKYKKRGPEKWLNGNKPGNRQF